MASGKFSALYEGTGEEPPVAPGPGLAGKDAGPAARRAAGGAPPGPREMSSEQAGTMNAPRSVPSDPIPGGRIFPGGAFDDPSISEMSPSEQPFAREEADANAEYLAGLAVGGAAGKVGGTLLGGIVGKVAPRLAPIASGAGAGASAAAATGEDAAGIVKGAALGAAFNLPAALEGIGVSMAKPSRDVGIVMDLSPDATAVGRQKMREIGYAKTAETARRYGVVGAPTPQAAHDSVNAGWSEIGKQIGDVYGAIGNEYARNAGGLVSGVKRETQGMRGTRSGNNVADAVEAEAARIQEIAGGSGESKITLRNLRKELSDAQGEGYGGKRFNQLDESEKAEVGRVLARHLQSELDAGLAAAAKDPRFASQVGRIPELNATWRALDVLKETTGRMVDRAQRRTDPGFIARSSSAVHTGTLGALGKPLPGSAQPVKMPTGRRRGIPVPAGEPLDPALTGALVNANADPDGMRASLRNIFFGGGGEQ